MNSLTMMLETGKQLKRIHFLTELDYLNILYHKR